MDKRSWPWKKKSPDKTSICTDVGDSLPLQTPKPSDDRGTQGLKLDHTRKSMVPVSQLQADEKIRNLNERLLAADDLAKQHATVAEEAVSGWETAKAECMSVKYQLDMMLEQKQAAEVRVFHLDTALKECMQQLRQFREEQEQKIHEAVIKRSRDWDKMRLELEERLADANRQLMEAGNQRNLLYTTMQEQAEAVAELERIRSEGESEIKKLQVQVQTLEKENTSLKYEIVVLNKELDIRNQEREINNRSFDMANRQQLESTKHIAKLEAECQRLRALVRKKLPGPGALLQMKLEAGVDVEKGDFYRKQRTGVSSVTSPKASHTDSIIQSERLLASEEETEMLREALARRNKRSQTARLRCAAVNLSSLDGQGQAESFPKSPRMPSIGLGFHVAESFQVPSQVSMSEDGNDDSQSVADSWTSGFFTASGYSQKEKSIQYRPNSVRSNEIFERLNSIDDFLEMERLVSLPSEKQSNLNVELSPSSIPKQVLAKDADIQAANRLCTEGNQRLTSGEEQLNLLHSKNVANEVVLLNIQQKLITILEAFDRGNPEIAREGVKNALSALQCCTMDELQAHSLKLSNNAAPDHSSGLSSLESPHFQNSLQGECFHEGKICKIGPELTAVICKLVRVVEELASEGQLATSGLRECQPANAAELENGHHNNQSASKRRFLEREASIRNFTAMSNQYLHGKTELVQFMAELCSVLSQMKSINLMKVHNSLSGRMKWRPDGVPVAEQDVFSDVGSPVSLTSNSDGSESLAAKGSPADDRLANSNKAPLDEDLRKARAEKEALESQLRAELSRTATAEQMLADLKQEKEELENKLEGERENFDKMKSQFLDSEQLVATLRTQIASAELSGMEAEKSLFSITAAKENLEAQLEDTHREVARLHEELKTLEGIICEEQKRNNELQIKMEQLEALLQRANTSTVEGDEGKSNRDQEIADATEKLAECQRTILNLGKQLKDIVCAQDASSIAIMSSTIATQEDAPKDQVQRHRKTVPNFKDKQRILGELVASSSADDTSLELTVEAEGPGPGPGPGPDPDLENHTGDVSLVKNSKSEKLSSSHAELDKQLVVYVPKPASRKKTSHLFGTIDMSKSLNLEPSASPRKSSSSFSRFFSRNKNTS